MRTIRPLIAAVLALVVLASSSAAQPLVGALAVDARQGDQWGWAVDYETTGTAQAAAALRECGSRCSVALTFGRCGAYAADRDDASTASGWAESYASADGARQRALAECRSRGGSGCVVRVWGCNGPVVEEELGLNQAARRQIQQGLQAEGFDPGGADGRFGPRTRAAIRSWQSARGARSTGYLDGPQVEALRGRGGSRPPAAAGAAAADSGGLELAFWQSIQNSTNPAEFEAYLRRFPNGVFSELAQVRLAALRGSTGGATTIAGQGVGGTVTSASGTRASGGSACLSVWNGWSRRCAATSGRDVPSRSNGRVRGWLGPRERKRSGGSALEIGRRIPGAWWMGSPTATRSSAMKMGPSPKAGPYVNGEMNGNWVLRSADGAVEEGPFVDGERTGHWGGTLRERDRRGRPVSGRQGERHLGDPTGGRGGRLYRDGERVR